MKVFIVVAEVKEVFRVVKIVVVLVFKVRNYYSSQIKFSTLNQQTNVEDW
jgi:hypothetical protein